MTTVNATNLVEAACRQFLADHPDLPLVLQTGIHPSYTYTRTPAAKTHVADQWCVRLIPSLDGALVSGSGEMFLGVNDVIDGLAGLASHGTSWRDPDPALIAGEEFQSAILALVRTKLAAVEAARKAEVSQ